MTLPVLARAILRPSTLDFEVTSNTGGRGPRGMHVWITHLPAWEPYEANIVRVGDVWVVLCQTLQEGQTIAQQHVSSQDFSATKSPSTADSSEAQANYMILSVKHIMLCRVTSSASLQCTAPESLFNGDCDTAPPSNLALDYLLWATVSARPAISTPIHSLPIEVQNMILSYEPLGTVVAVRIGCLLGLGSPFLWRDGLLKLTLEARYLNRPTGSSVESEIWFIGRKSGMVYLARDSKS